VEEEAAKEPEEGEKEVAAGRDGCCCGIRWAPWPRRAAPGRLGHPTTPMFPVARRLQARVWMYFEAVELVVTEAPCTCCLCGRVWACACNAATSEPFQYVFVHRPRDESLGRRRLRALRPQYVQHIRKDQATEITLNFRMHITFAHHLDFLLAATAPGPSCFACAVADASAEGGGGGLDSDDVEAGARGIVAMVRRKSLKRKGMGRGDPGKGGGAVLGTCLECGLGPQRVLQVNNAQRQRRILYEMVPAACFLTFTH